MERGCLRGIVVAASLVFGVMAVSSPALALTPPPVDQASVVFSNGKRLIRIKADATDREVLTLKSSFISSIDGLHDTALAGSPDGKSVLFRREDWSDRPTGPQGLMSLMVDGGKPKLLVKQGSLSWIQAATFSADGSLI